MAVAQPLPILRAALEETERDDVVRRVSFLGPVSPELALVDPELASRARALLPEPAAAWLSCERDSIQAPLRLEVVRPPTPARAWPPRAVAIAVAATVAAAAGLTATFVGREASPPRTATPTLGAPPVAPIAAPSSAPRSTATAPARATGANGATPSFVWPAREGAKGYRVALFHDGGQIFERDVTATRLEMPSGWTYEGRSYELSPGTYRWVVWPLVGREKRIGTAIVSAEYVA